MKTCLPVAASPLSDLHPGQKERDTRHIKPTQLARRWRINPRTLQNWRCRGSGPPYLKIGGQILYRQEDVERYEAENQHKDRTSL